MTTTPEPKTPEQIIGELQDELEYRVRTAVARWRAASRIGDPYAPSLAVQDEVTTGRAVIANKAAGLLAAAPTEEQIERAAKAAYDDAFLAHAPEDVDRWEALAADNAPAAESWRSVARAALAAAAGVAPQEPSERHDAEERVRAVSTGAPEVRLLACVECGVLLWDIDAHYGHAHPEAECDHPNHGNSDHDCAPFSSATEPAAPSPDREKLIEAAIAASDRVNHEELCSCEKPPEACAMYSHRPWSHDPELVANEVLRLAALAAPVEVDEAKLAVVLREHGWYELTNRCECGERPADMELHQAAKVAELLRGAV